MAAVDPTLPPPPWSPAPSPTRPQTPPVDPDAPILTRRRRRPGGPIVALGGRRDRSVTTDADLVAPSSIDRNAFDHVRSGQSYTRTFAVLTLPRLLKPGALFPIMQLPGVQTALVNNPLPRAIAKERLTHMAHQMGVSLNQGGDDVTDEALALKDLRRVLAGLTEEQSALHLAGIYLTIAGADLPELNARTR